MTTNRTVGERWYASNARRNWVHKETHRDMGYELRRQLELYRTDAPGHGLRVAETVGIARGQAGVRRLRGELVSSHDDTSKHAVSEESG